jgi:hypothetical protein
VIGSVRRDLDGRSDEQSSKNWLSSLTGAYDDLEANAMQEEQTRRLESAAEWSAKIQTRVTNEVANALADFGFPVTQKLVEQLVRQLEAAGEELGNDANKLEEEADAALNKIASAFNAVRGVITPQHQQFSVAARDRAERLFKHSEAELYRFTETLLRELVTGFFTPLRRALASAERRLRTTVEESSKVVEQWSSSAVPPHLMPAPNEILLESHTEFPGRFDRLMEIDFEDGVKGAIREVVSGAWRRADGSDDGAKEDPDQTLIRVQPNWQPAILGTLAPEIKLDLDPGVLLSQAEAWIKRRREGSITKYARGNLNEWLDGDASDSADRAARFADAFELALAASAPLVSISSKTYEFVHGAKVPAPSPVVSTLPIGRDHDAADRVVKAITDLGVAEGDIDELFRPTVARSAVEISSFLPLSVHPSVFGSLTGPILADWQSRKTPQDRSQFWAYRRARQLRSFVPMSESRQRSFIRGWLTANLLGHIEPLKRPWREGPLEVWTPTGPRAFPEHLLGKEVRQHGAVLPALLESLPLALLTLGSGDVSEFEAFVRVLDLGTAADDVSGTGRDYEEVNSELLQWVMDGDTTSGSATFDDAPSPPSALAGSATDGPDERKAVLLSSIEEYLKAQHEHAAEEVTPGTSLSMGRGWELSRITIQAADQIAAAIGAIRTDAAKTWG